MRLLKYMCLGMLFCGLPIQMEAQQTLDTLQIRQWIDSAWNLRYTQPDTALVLAKKALSQSRDRYYYGMLNSLQICGEAQFQLGALDSSLNYYYQALEISIAEKDLEENANNYTSLATIYMESGDRDSALYYFHEAINTFQEVADSSALCDALLRCGNVYNDLGNYDQAVTYYMNSIRICEAIHKDDYIAYNYGAIGTVHDKQRNYLKAEEYFLKARDEFERLGNLYGLMTVANNLGILYKNMNDFEKSLKAFSECLLYADSTGFGRGTMGAHTNLGILNVRMGQFENGLYHSALGLQLAREFQDREAVADNFNWVARAQVGLGDFNTALQNATESLRIGNEVQSLEKQRDANLTISEIYQAQHAYDLSLEYYKAYTAIKDSLFNDEQSRQISELQTVYETEKKDQEIRILAKNAEIDSVRKTRLWIGLGLSLLAGALLIYGQWVRRVRDKKIHSQEKELETQRRKTIELENDRISRELDFKKQELAAKALQLARKNEFLQSLNEEVDNLRGKAEGAVADSARKISRQIRMDIASEEEWDQFLASFREVHRDFMEQLQHIYPSISKGEIRLACLMKMNLSAKELATILNVTTEGIKKARYRLRKKMDLASDVDIQEFFLAFPATAG